MPSKLLKAGGNVPGIVLINAASEPDWRDIQVEGEAADKPKLRGFTMLAYTGGAMGVGGFYRPVVVDLAGMKVSGGGKTPILRGHDPDQIVGHGKVTISAKDITVDGVISAENSHSQEVVSSSRNGFPWQASIGASVKEYEVLGEKDTAVVNGQTIKGPALIARKSVLSEVSFVPMGADSKTSAKVAASAAIGDPKMNKFHEWLKAKNIEVEGLDQAIETVLKAQFDAEVEAAKKVATSTEEDPSQAEIKAARKARADETRRIADIVKACNGKHPEIEAKAIEDGSTAGEVALHVLRAERATPVNHGTGGGLKMQVKDDVLQAALCMTIRTPNIEKVFKAETLQAAHDSFPRGIGLQQILIQAAVNAGCDIRPGDRLNDANLRRVLKFAMPGEDIRAGFSTLSLPGILSNVANKELLAGYMDEDQSWREVAAIKTVNDFKQVTSYRLLDNMIYEKLGAAGEIKHGTLGEESYTRQAETYAKMFALTRRDIINDDLGAFEDLRNRLGRGAAIKFNDVFWTEFMSNASTFWTTALTNYIEGSTTNLGTDGVGLGLGVKAFRLMRSPSADGSKRIAGRPEILLVPPELESIADNLYQNRNLGQVKVADANIYANKYRPVVVPWLSDSNFTGYSTTAWYLLRNPAISAAVVVSFLNGMQTPTVESAEADFDTLGVQFRGYHDFGCDQAEYLAGVKSKGAA